MIAIHISAGHDRNGNPKRGYIITTDAGSFIDFIEEGPEGKASLQEYFPNIAISDRIDVTPSSYSDAKKLRVKADKIRGLSGHGKRR